MTERLYTIVYKDFFTAYERSNLFYQKIQKFTAKDIEENKSSNLSNSDEPMRISVM